MIEVLSSLVGGFIVFGLFALVIWAGRKFYHRYRRVLDMSISDILMFRFGNQLGTNGGRKPGTDETGKTS